MPDILMEQESAVPTQEVKRGLRKEKSCGLVRCLLNTSHNCQDILRSEVEAEHRRHPYSIANLGFFWYVHTPWLRVVLFKKISRPTAFRVTEGASGDRKDASEV